MTEMTEFHKQSHPSQDLTPKVVISLLAQKPWTERELRDAVVRLGYIRESFDTIFQIIKQDPRVQSWGITPVYYTLRADE